MSTKQNNFFTSDERDAFKCPVCWEFACQPYLLKPCGHFMCKNCLHGLQKSNSSNTCPVCRGHIEISLLHKEMEFQMSQLEEECPGCQDVVTLCTMRQHVMSCQILKNLEKYSNQISSRKGQLINFIPKNGSRRGLSRGQGGRGYRHWQGPRNCLKENARRKSSPSDLSNDEEDIDEISEEGHQQFGHSYSHPQRQPCKSKANNIQRPPSHQRGRGSRRGNRRTWPPSFGKDTRPVPESSLDSDNEADSASGAAEMPGRVFLDPSQGVRPKYQSNTPTSYCKMPHLVHQPAVSLIGTTLFSTENAFVARTNYQSNTQTSYRRMPPPANLPTGTVSRSSPSPDTASAASSIQTDNPQYLCPYCGQPGMSQLELVNHCLDQHSFEKRCIVCPICASLAWGNPNQISANFIDHLRRRHNFDYKSFVTNEDDEEAMLSMAMEASLRDI